MFDIQNYSSFLVTIIVFQLIPGAGTVSILNATARNGIGCGMSAVIGTLIGDFIYMLAAVLGLATILNAYPTILTGAQWFGVVYLCWIGLKLLLTSEIRQFSCIVLEQKGWVYFRQALFVSLTNPKVIMFFMAFFPLFLSADSTSATLLILMLHVTAISFLYQAILVLSGNAVAKRLSYWRYARLAATRLAGVTLLGFAVKLAFNNR